MCSLFSFENVVEQPGMYCTSTWNMSLTVTSSPAPDCLKVQIRSLQAIFMSPPHKKFKSGTNSTRYIPPWSCVVMFPFRKRIVGNDDRCR